MSDPGYRLSIEGMDEVIRMGEIYPDLYVEHMGNAVMKLCYIGEFKAKEEAPVFMGHLRASITSQLQKPSSVELFGLVGVSLKKSVYPLVMEFGRRPGAKPPPPAALIRWVQLVLRVPEDQEWQAARALSLSISRKGIQGREYMKAGFEAVLDAYDAVINEGVDNILERI